MERCVECIEEVARLAPEGGPLAAYRILPQVLEYVRSMRDPFYLSLQSGELRGITLVELQASRIIELHEAMKNIIAMEETEMQYGRGGRQSKLDKALAERGMRRAPEASYIAGDCVFDSQTWRLVFGRLTVMKILSLSSLVHGNSYFVSASGHLAKRLGSRSMHIGAYRIQFRTRRLACKSFEA